MISEHYKRQLMKEAKQLDVALGQASELEKLAQEITDEQIDKASLEFIKNLGILTKNTSLPSMEQKQEKEIETLYKYLGASKVDNLTNSARHCSPRYKLATERIF